MTGFYYVPGSRRVSRGQRFGLMARYRLWKRRRKMPDLAGVSGWCR